jgi:uncharacterized protein
MSAYHIDINTTKNCNLRCNYCYEVKNDLIRNKAYEDPEAFIKFCDDFMETEYFKKEYGTLNINFWGGEPTMNKPLFNQIVSHYLEDDRVKMFMFSNGFHIDEYYLDMFAELQKIKIQGEPKFVIQISYDGAIIHDIDRVDIKGAGSSERVKQTINNLKERGIFYVIKSTIAPENFKHLFEAYMDVTPHQLPGQNYFPTIDLHLTFEEGDESYKQYGPDLYDQLVKIAAHEKKNGLNQFAFFRGTKALCAAGAHMLAIDTNGNMLPCHGALYSDYDEHLIGNVSDEDAVQKVINKAEWYKTFWRNQPEECKNCTNSFCNRCNVVKFEHSKKDTYEEKWSDHTCQPYQCYYFDIIDLVGRANKSVG